MRSPMLDTVDYSQELIISYLYDLADMNELSGHFKVSKRKVVRELAQVFDDLESKMQRRI